MGLYYYRNRYFEPVSGRFTSRDPLLYVDGPNVYAYTNNNPTGFKDWSGTEITADPARDGCDGYVHFYSTQEHKSKRTAKARALEEVRSSRARMSADAQCQLVATRINKACILRKGVIVTKTRLTQSGAETRKAKKARKEGRAEAVKKGTYRKSQSCDKNWVARIDARWRCRSVRTLRDELIVKRRYIEEDLDAIEYEEKKRKWVKHTGIAILVSVGAYRTIKSLSFGGGAVGLAGFGARIRAAAEARRLVGVP